MSSIRHKVTTRTARRSAEPTDLESKRVHSRPADERRPSDERQLRVLVADDDPLVRRLIRQVLKKAGIAVVAEAENGREAVRLARLARPDVALLDVVMPGMDGLAALERIMGDERARTRIVMLSVREDHEVALVALRKGAIGYLGKEIGLEDLPTVVRDAWRGDAVISRSTTTELVKRLRDLPERGVGTRPVKSVLTPREWEVVDLLCLGKSAEGIADALVIALETVHSHLKNIMRKLGVHSRAEIVSAAEHLRTGGLGDLSGVVLEGSASA